MQLDIEKCAMLTIKREKREKRETTERTEQPIQENIRTFGEEKNYKYLGILEADTIDQTEMKEKIRKENLRREPLEHS